MKYFFSILASVCAAAMLPILSHGAAPDKTSPTYVIPIKGQIERALVYAIRRGVAEAQEHRAGAIIFDMNTPGGRLDAAEDIIDIITSVDMPTYTFVNNNAISAGAIIAMGTDHIYMTPGGLIGDAMPIMMSPLPMGGPAEIPEGLKEKASSPTAALIRSAAQRKGHDPNLAEAMVRPDIGYKIGDKVICATNRLVTLTSKEAEQLVGEDNHHLLSEGTVNNLSELLAKIGRAGNPIVTITITSAEQIARVIDSFPYSGILLALGLLFLYIEFKTPGVILPGVVGAILLIIWFWGHKIAGLAGTGDIVLFLIGVSFILVEIFILPGHGVTGVIGTVCITASLIMAMVRHVPGGPWYKIRTEDMRDSILNLGVAVLVTLVAGAILARFLPKTNLFHRIMLDTSLTANDGYRASSESTATLVGRKGVAATQLHPSGIGLFGDRRLDVVTRGELVEQGKPIVIAEAHGNRIVVETVTEDSRCA